MGARSAILPPNRFPAQPEVPVRPLRSPSRLVSRQPTFSASRASAPQKRRTRHSRRRSSETRFQPNSSKRIPSQPSPGQIRAPGAGPRLSPPCRTRRDPRIRRPSAALRRSASPSRPSSARPTRDAPRRKRRPTQPRRDASVSLLISPFGTTRRHGASKPTLNGGVAPRALPSTAIPTSGNRRRRLTRSIGRTRHNGSKFG
jgi:hypothetical protein